MVPGFWDFGQPALKEGTGLNEQLEEQRSLNQHSCKRQRIRLNEHTVRTQGTTEPGSGLTAGQVRPRALGALGTC